MFILKLGAKARLNLTWEDGARNEPELAPARNPSVIRR